MAVCCGFTEIELLHLPCGLIDSLRQSCGILWHPVALCQEAACPCCPKIYKRPKRSRCRCWKLSSAQKLASCRCKRWKGNLGGIAILKQFEDIPRHVNCPSSSFLLFLLLFILSFANCAPVKGWRISSASRKCSA